jgi:L-threonylcarbamoyladenylate synthase
MGIFTSAKWDSFSSRRGEAILASVVYSVKIYTIHGTFGFMQEHCHLISTKSNSLEQIISRGVDIMRNGGLVAYPTDTLYGLGCDPWNSKAVRHLFQAKKRPPSQPVPLLLADIKSLNDVALSLSKPVLDLVSVFWPGALTLIVQKAAGLANEITANSDTVAVRIPNHPIAQGLAFGIGGAIVGTSANISGNLDTVTAEQVLDQLRDSVDLIIDGGCCQNGRGSTILDVSDQVWKILREGPVTRNQLKDFGFASYIAN